MSVILDVSLLNGFTSGNLNLQEYSFTSERISAAEIQEVDIILANTLKKMAETVTEPSFGTNFGERSVLCLARGGYYSKDDKYFSDYYDRIVDTVNETVSALNKDGALHKAKSTENSKLILALSSI